MAKIIAEAEANKRQEAAAEKKAQILRNRLKKRKKEAKGQSAAEAKGTPCEDKGERSLPRTRSQEKIASLAETLM